MSWYERLVKWFRWVLKRYEKEIVETVDCALDNALSSIDSELVLKLTPKIRKQVKKFITEQIDEQGLDPKAEDFTDVVAIMVMKEFDNKLRG